ncbi:hypothetical protein ACHAXR_000316, partial [Thalassiosira sp. AJA248-18]
MRDTTHAVMSRICPVVQYCKSADNVKREKTRVKETAGKLRPFDLSFIINHITSSRLKGSSPLAEIGFDVTAIAPSIPATLQENANPQINSISLVEEGERGKFKRDNAASDQSSGLTLPGDQFIGKLYTNNTALTPQAMDRWGSWSPLFDRFFLRDRSAPAILSYDASKNPNTILMNKCACSLDVPFGILNTANKIWMKSHPDTWFGD